METYDREMRWLLVATIPVLLPVLSWATVPQGNGPQEAQVAASASTAPMPDVNALLADVERNQKRMEALQRDYTYHVHTVEQELDKSGGVKKTETQDAESVTISGVRVDEVVARNGKPLSAEDKRKEDERVDKEVAKAKERQAKLEAKGSMTDERGNEVMPLSRILELGSFSNPRRVEQNGRPALLVDYAGNPRAKTHNSFEGIMRDVVGTVTIDEQDRVLVHAQGQFQNDFKLGGGLVADVRKGSSFAFTATRVGDGVWLPADIQGEGSVRVLLLAHFSGRMRVTTSDYRRFRASATIVGSHGAIGPEGEPITPTATPPKPGQAAPPL